jgi:outer membrane protein insertion porin family
MFRRDLIALVSLFWTFSAAPPSAEAQIPQELVAQPIVEIQLDQEGSVVNEPAVLRLIEARVGDRLEVRSVRETIAHLMALGRFEDVQVLAEPVSGGVRVKYVLLPRHPIDRIEFVGRTELSEDDLRRLITDRFGSSPGVSRLSEVTEALRLSFAAAATRRRS